MGNVGNCSAVFSSLTCNSSRIDWRLSADNWALVYAQQLALEEKLPLHVCFCLVPRYLESTYRQYAFMLRGLQEVAKVNISLILDLNFELRVKSLSCRRFQLCVYITVLMCMFLL